MEDGRIVPLVQLKSLVATRERPFSGTVETDKLKSCRALFKSSIAISKVPLHLPLPFAVDCSLLVLCGKSPGGNETAKTIKTSNALKLPDNGEFTLSLHSEVDKAVMQGSFQVHSYMNSLSTNQFGRLLIWSPLLTSTHDVVSHNFCKLPIGTVCVADAQTKGRGRSKNVLESPLGCLMFSFTLQMEDGRIVPLVQYVVSLAITEAIKDICDKNGLPFWKRRYSGSLF
ncbi:biotin--protein ligase 1, chloroplastic [Cajanus cajan]|uniref:biotin--protein ligase 1, chloroplastic n=1 Tax=Cajanus cajan TaxID=3821 RepID=UPI0010FAF086|nr:biotin--protein ligase 1, chloroplastic [Cajanus cajan]